MRKNWKLLPEAARKQLNKQFSEDAPLPEGTPLSKETAKVGQTVFLPSLRQMVRLLLLTAAM